MSEENKDTFPVVNQSKWNDIHQIFYKGQNYYRVVDVIDALEVAQDPANYWSLMKRRVKTEGFQETRQGIIQFELKSPKDKRLRKHDYATRVVLLRLVQSIPSPHVEGLKIWLAETGELRIQQQEIERVETELEAIRADYRRQGRDEKWIEDRIQNIVGRNTLTDQWRKRGAIEHLHFARLTSILHKGALGVSPSEHREMKRLPGKTNPREHMDRVELALLTLAEATTTAKHIENDTQGVPGLEKDVRETAKASEAIRELTERNLGRPVVSPENFLPPKREKKQLPPATQGELLRDQEPPEE
jgi:DNA-damage-inducible protein D